MPVPSSRSATGREASATVRVGAPATGRRRVSVVIPTFNEAERLPLLLDHLGAQTRQPDEIIVADACSSDGTRAIASARGAQVVEGGRPGAGRNSGAAAATGDLLLFMDADAEPAPDFLERALEEFDRRGLSVATAPMRAAETGVEFDVLFAVAELYIRALQRISPHAVGLCILALREVHERIGGFDETVVLAEDHEYVRRAARVGKFRVLRSVKVPTPMRRVQKEGRFHMARVLFFSEVRTLAGIPIRSVPFAYEFGAFEGTHTPRARRILRELGKPSTELQTDAIGFGVAALGGGVGAAALASAGVSPGAYLPVAGVAATVAALSGYEVSRRKRFEKPYGDFFIASVAVASSDLRDDEGRTIVHEGVDEICELHAIGNLGRMSELNRQGTPGRLTIMLETLQGFRAMIDDLDDPAYRDVSYFTARSDLTTLLFKMGFEEIADPPRYNLVNRTEKRAFMWLVGRRVGRTRTSDPESYRMAVASRVDLTGERMLAAVDAQIARARRALERANGVTPPA